MEIDKDYILILILVLTIIYLLFKKRGNKKYIVPNPLKLDEQTGWYQISVCISCKKHVDEYTRFYNHGVCNMCGYKGPNAATIVATEKFTVRRFTKGNVAKPIYTYLGRTIKDTAWLKANDYELEVIDDK